MKTLIKRAAVVVGGVAVLGTLTMGPAAAASDYFGYTVRCDTGQTARVKFTYTGSSAAVNVTNASSNTTRTSPTYGAGSNRTVTWNSGLRRVDHGTAYTPGIAISFVHIGCA